MDHIKVSEELVKIAKSLISGDDEEANLVFSMEIPKGKNENQTFKILENYVEGFNGDYYIQHAMGTSSTYSVFLPVTLDNKNQARKLKSEVGNDAKAKKLRITCEWDN